MVHNPESLVEMTQQQTCNNFFFNFFNLIIFIDNYLSVHAKAALIDRFTVLIQQMGITLQHKCHR